MSWKATAEYDLTSDMMLYATVSTGYRAGGVADKLTPVAAQTFRPEYLTNTTSWVCAPSGQAATLFGQNWPTGQSQERGNSGVFHYPATWSRRRRGIGRDIRWRDDARNSF